MKKILFRKLLLDCIVFFLVSLISTSVIIWVFQAVNFLDIIVEDGRDFLVYLNYSLFNFPKIISKILPFATFFSFCYILNRYELNNELIIFWNFGVHKIELINFFFKFSILLMIIQMMLTTYVVPTTQNHSRSVLKNSNVDFFESFIKPKKFNDNIKGLTIYADEKDKNGKLKNIYLKKDSGNNNYQITLAKTGEFKTINKSKILVLYNGQTLNSNNNKITNFNFSKSDFTLSQLDTDVVTQEKIQETSTLAHIACLEKYLMPNTSSKKDLNQYDNPNCTSNNLDNIFQELYKRFVMPFYLPILILVSLFLIINSKENALYSKHKIIIFIVGLIIIILSESSIKFVNKNFYENLKFFLAPIIIMFFVYFLFRFKFIYKIKN
jgi:lipopolysaccharide export system permease protein